MIFLKHIKHGNLAPYAPTLEELAKRAVKYDGILFASLEDIRQWKKASGRPKDITDIKLIDNLTSHPRQ
jgi:hypothetical protein